MKQVVQSNQTLPLELSTRDEYERILLRRASRGDRAAFETLYRAYHRRLKRFLGRLSRHQELVEETINDVFWVVWKKSGGFRGQSLVSTWIMGIAYRCALKTIRSVDSALWDSVPLDDEIATVVDPRADHELRDWLERGLSHLSAEQRMTIELAYYCGHSCEEIAHIMDCPTGTVKARLFRARVMLRNLLPVLGGDSRRTFR